MKRPSVSHWSCCRARMKTQATVSHFLSLQFVCRAWRSFGSVFWLIQWRRLSMQPVTTALPKEAAWAPLWRGTRTTSSTAMSAKASALMSTSGWASMTWWPTGSGWTNRGPVCVSRTGRQRSPSSRMGGASRTVPSSLLRPVGGGLMRTAKLRRLQSVSSTLSETWSHSADGHLST